MSDGMIPGSPELAPELRRQLLAVQRNEITEYHVYTRLAQRQTDAHNRGVLQRIAEAQADPSAIEEWRSRFLPERRRRLLFILHRAAERGELRPDIQLEIVADIIFGFSWYRLLTGQIDDDLHVITAMVREIVQGITRKNIKIR